MTKKDKTAEKLSGTFCCTSSGILLFVLLQSCHHWYHFVHFGCSVISDQMGWTAVFPACLAGTTKVFLELSIVRRAESVCFHLPLSTNKLSQWKCSVSFQKWSGSIISEAYAKSAWVISEEIQGWAPGLNVPPAFPFCVLLLGGHPNNWTAISRECLNLLSDLTQRLIAQQEAAAANGRAKQPAGELKVPPWAPGAWGDTQSGL